MANDTDKFHMFRGQAIGGLVTRWCWSTFGSKILSANVNSSESNFSQCFEEFVTKYPNKSTDNRTPFYISKK